ncbi:MAG: DegQ family serine endoprotease [Micavibrio aeruginosavorus]|nr:DegQ family serine endoprotease [Micavibrio aeruginosavorus]
MRTIMRFSRIALIPAVVLALSPAGFSAPAFAQSNYGPSSLAPLVEKLLPAVVNISSTQKMEETQAPENLPEMPQFPPGSPFQDFFEEFMNKHGGEMNMAPPTSLGSGFIIDAEKGIIVTNAHVIQDADEVRVTLHDDTTMSAEVLGRDEKTDLAVLKVNTKHPLTAVTFGDSAPLRVGDWILAIGNPFGLGGTVTTGIVSAQQRDINAGPYDDFIQTDASINRGNSGGPMFNMNGEVIGINTAIYSPSGGSVGIGFAIPSNLAKPVIDQLSKFGKTRRGWLGVRIQTVTEDIAESFGLQTHGGALIASVTPTGPAEKAGLKAGDIILEFDGKSVTQMRTLPRIVAETEIGKTSKIVFWRNGKREETSVTVGELEKAEEDGLITAGGKDDLPGEEPSGVKIDSVGMTVSSIAEQDRSAYDIPADVDGTLITDVTPGKEAAEKGLTAGDVIVEINQQPASDSKTAADIIAKTEKSGRNSVLLLINRAGEVRFVALRLKAEEKTKSDKKSN